RRTCARRGAASCASAPNQQRIRTSEEPRGARTPRGKIRTPEADRPRTSPEGPEREVPEVTPKHKRTWLLSAVALVVGFALLAAACGSSKKSSATTSSTGTTGAP